MAQINFADQSLTCKIVFCGPGLSGKTTNLERIYERIPQHRRGELTSIQTYGDRTIFYDYLPVDLGNVLGMTTKMQLYTVPGQPYYAATRKLVLVGVDGVVFIADSQRARLAENLEALKELQQGLRDQGKDLATLPAVFCWNKRDLPDLRSVKELERALNPFKAPSFETVATEGQNVLSALKALSHQVLEACRDEYGEKERPALDSQVEVDTRAAVARKRPEPARSTSSRKKAQPPPKKKKKKRERKPREPGEEPIGDTVGGCVIMAKLGEGGMGSVYLARHKTLGKNFVIKTLKPEQAENKNSVRRFFLEARSTARLEHENVVRVQDVGTDARGMHYMVMQYVDGENLEERVREKGAVKPKEALRIVFEVAKALEATHEAGVVHRDVKPQNIVITGEGLVKLIDFGLARVVGEEARLTRSGGIVGTPAFMAPEMFQRGQVDGRVDLFALGLTFYYLLTGMRPFEGTELHDLFLGKARLRPPERCVKGVPSSYRHLLERMLAQDPEARYQEASELINDLKTLKRGKKLPAVQEGPFWLWDDGLIESDEDTRILAPSAREELVQATTSVAPRIARESLEQVDEGLLRQIEWASRNPGNHVESCILLSELDQGCVGVLHRAWDSRAKQIVALREVRALGRLDKRGQRELAEVARMKHDRIPRLHRTIVEGGTLFCVLDLVRGRTLSGFRYRAKRVVTAVADAAEGLSYAHGRGIVHGLIQPTSLLIDTEGRGHLLDFGLSGILERGRERGAKNLPQVSTRYQPPECLQGPGDARSDIYALGAILYFGLTRHPPGTGSIVPPRQLARGIPKPIEATCMRALEHDPDQRFGSPDTMAAELRAFLEQGKRKERH